ncbi:pectin lyase-like protein [Westerdykella ornata]|uniref:Pectin lyase-like protein n=1 Tax=Westerdykella ornata TaxID=318751 RepID=A0A6A6JKM6_WESOR|nr:pectin lyase-like protein [Westerdykella ornata]KAF2275439.1 pectin lyase-like protein [Westerdykella ornata]
MKSKILLIYAALCSNFVAAVDFYVAPNGSDNGDGTSPTTAFQTLSKAQQAVRKQIASGMQENITVHVGPGTYSLSAPLKFTADDSGKGGFTVHWVGSGALISGGQKVTGWTAGSNGVYSASVPAGLKSRNLYVNGKASNYARKKIANRKDFTYTSTGMKWTSSSYDWITSTPGIAGAELRFLNSFADRYAPIKSAGNRELVMEQNTWYNQLWGYDTVNKNNADFGVWVQNALALLTEGGQFYLDSGAGKVYYKPLSGERMDSIEAYLGVLEALVIFGGTYTNPVHDISFEGISFAHTTWLQPNEIGYVDQQTGGNLCENKTYDSSNFESTRPYWCQMPSAIQISAAKNIVLSGGNYTQLGAGGIGIGNDANAHVTGVGLGASNVAIKDGYFTQVMGNSITAGGIRADAHHPSDSRMVNTNIEVSNNIFYNVSSLFSSTVPILFTYVQYSTISHNDVYITPYSGICHGYGWGSNDAGGSSEYVKRGLYKYQPQYTTPTIMQNNKIVGNLIHGYGYSHTDLGAVYTLSKSPSTEISANYAYDSGGFGMYTDEGSNSYLIQNNIFLSNGIWYAQNGVNTANNTIVGNYGKTGQSISKNTIVSDVSQVSVDALKSAYRAGVLPGKRNGRPVSNNAKLADGAAAISSSNGNAVVTLYNFDDVAFSNVTVSLSASGATFTVVSVPTAIPASGTATATYKVSGTNKPRVSATVKYWNPRVGASSTVSASGQI